MRGQSKRRRSKQAGSGQRRRNCAGDKVNLSDADFTYSGPAVVAVNTILQTLAPQFGYDPADPDYLLNFRNPVLSYLTAERLMMIYSEKGREGVRAEVQKVRDAGAI